MQKASSREGEKEGGVIRLLEDHPSSTRYFPSKTDIVLHGATSSQSCVFYRSANGYFLTGDPIPATHIVAVTIRETGESVEAEGYSELKDSK